MLSSSLVRSMPKNADIHRMAPRPPYPNTGPSTHRVYARVDSSASTTHKTEPKPVSLRPVYILTLCLHHMGESIVQNFSWVCTAGLPISYTFGLSMPYLFAVEIWFQIQDQFWIPHWKVHGHAFWFFCKPSKHARLTSRRALVFSSFFLVQYRPLSWKPSAWSTDVAPVDNAEVQEKDGSKEEAAVVMARRSLLLWHYNHWSRNCLTYERGTGGRPRPRRGTVPRRRRWTGWIVGANGLYTPCTADGGGGSSSPSTTLNKILSWYIIEK